MPTTTPPPSPPPQPAPSPTPPPPTQQPRVTKTPTETTIYLPGIQDIIRIPALENQSLIRERINRFKDAQRNSPLPPDMKWMPAAINLLDNAQDILITGLIAAKWIAPKLLGRAIPYLGWALLLNDAMNAANSVLQIATSGTGGKKVLKDAFLTAVGGRKARLNNASTWMKGNHLSSFMWQAPQVMQNLTGYGLSLGAIFGAIGDATWGTIRALQGRRIRIVGPPQNDLMFRAGAWLIDSGNWLYALSLVSPMEAAMMFCVNHLALGMLDLWDDISKLDSRADLAMATQLPDQEIWNPASRQALQEQGWDPDAPLQPLTPSPLPYQSIGHVTGDAAHAAEHLEEIAANLFAASDLGTSMQQMAQLDAIMILDALQGQVGATEPQLRPQEIILMLSIEHGYFPPPAATSQQLIQYTDLLHTIIPYPAPFSGLTDEHFEWASQRIWGGHCKANGFRIDALWTWSQQEYGIHPIGCDMPPARAETLDTWRKCITTAITQLPDCYTLTQDPPDKKHDPCPGTPAGPCAQATKAARHAQITIATCAAGPDGWTLLLHFEKDWWVDPDLSNRVAAFSLEILQVGFQGGLTSMQDFTFICPYDFPPVDLPD